MVSLMRRRAMMQNEEDDGVEYFLFDKSVSLENAGSGSLSSTIYHVIITNDIIGASTASTKAPGTTVSYTNFATDGKHIWVTFNRVSTVTYNGAPVNYKKSGDYWQIEIPDNFDPAIPFVFS